MYEAPIAYVLNGLAAAAATSPNPTTANSDTLPEDEWE